MAKKRTGTRRSADPRLRAPELELISGILTRIPGTHARAVLDDIKDGAYKRATEHRIDPRSFSTPSEFALALNSVSLFRKYPGFPGENKKKEAAIEKWRACEESCLETNLRILLARRGAINAPHSEAFRLARSKISKLLGSFRWSKVARFFDFGPGSTTRLAYARRHLPYKFGPEPQTTFDNLATACSIIGTSRSWCYATGGHYVDGAAPCFRITEQSKVTTVPKDAFIDRVIAIEPDMNMFVQKGFGGFIRNRLKRVGIDLDDQTLNQLLARSGSLGGLATLDLSSASDTVAYELVKELLPPEWFEALLSCRTHESRLPSGEIVQLQKFSAMGNGYTFELESLIFWALCSSVCTETIGREGLRVSVYGDDIITSVADYGAVVDLLEWSGFTVNLKKSFCDGPYRESCGKHYFYGRDVTPITITKELSHASRLLLLCNNIQRWCYTAGLGQYRDAVLKPCLDYCIGELPAHMRQPRIPLGCGDGALLGSFDEVKPRRSGRGWDGWVVANVLVPRTRLKRSGGVATLAASLYKLDRGVPSKPTLFHDVNQDPQGYPVLLCSFGCPGYLGVPRNRREVGRLSKGEEEVRLEFEPSGSVCIHCGHPLPSTEPARLDAQGIGLSVQVRRSFNWFGYNVSDRALYELGGVETTPASSVRTENGYKLGVIFLSQWCDIGPWVP